MKSANYTMNCTVYFPKTWDDGKSFTLADAVEWLNVRGGRPGWFKYFRVLDNPAGWRVIF